MRSSLKNWLLPAAVIAAHALWLGTTAPPSRAATDDDEDGSQDEEGFEGDGDDPVEAALDFEVTSLVQELTKASALAGTTSPSFSGCDSSQDAVARLTCLRAGIDKWQAEQSAALAKSRSRPTIPPAYGMVTSRFGYRRSPFGDKKAVFHAGIDIGAPVNSVFVATADGVVTALERKNGYGALLTIEHAEGMETRFAHAGAIFVKPGDQVRRGQVLGSVGRSGKTTGPHLHYEIRINGQHVDPGPYVDLPTLADVQKQLRRP